MTKASERSAPSRRLRQVGVQEQQYAGLGPVVSLLDHPERIDGGLDGGGLAPVAGMGDHDRAGRGRPVPGAI